MKKSLHSFKFSMLFAFVICSMTVLGDGNTSAPFQISDTRQPDTTVYDYTKVDEKPEFPGGNDKMMAYIGQNFNYPVEAKTKNIQGLILVKFMIAASGEITNVEVVRGKQLGGGLAQEAARVVSHMPKWKPAKVGGKPVNVAFTVPVVCKISPKKATQSADDFIETLEEDNARSDTYDYGKVDKKPEFPGGNDKIMAYIGRNFQYPAQAKRKNIQGMILVKFIIAKTGEVTGVKVVRGNDLGGGLAEEAARVVKNMPKWEPGKMQGELVNVAYTIPIVCRIPSKTKTTNSPTKAVGENGVYNYASVEKKPEFPGGNGKIMTYVGKTFNYPAEAKKKNIQGLVLVKFIIDENGKVTNVKAVRGQDLGAGLAEEAERVVKTMPQWTPGMQNGKAVKVAYTLPVVCRLQSTKKEITGRTIAIPEKE